MQQLQAVLTITGLMFLYIILKNFVFRLSMFKQNIIADHQK